MHRTDNTVVAVSEAFGFDANLLGRMVEGGKKL